MYVQKQLGHSSIAITVDIYGHWVTGEGRGDLEKSLGKPKKVVPKSHIFAYPGPKQENGFSK